MSLTGDQARQLHDAILSAFSRAELEKLVRFDFNASIEQVARTNATLDTIVLVARSISGGRVNIVGLRLPEDEEVVVPPTRKERLKRKLADIWSSVAGI